MSELRLDFETCDLVIERVNGQIVVLCNQRWGDLFSIFSFNKVVKVSFSRHNNIALNVMMVWDVVVIYQVFLFSGQIGRDCQHLVKMPLTLSQPWEPQGISVSLLFKNCVFINDKAS